MVRRGSEPKVVLGDLKLLYAGVLRDARAGDQEFFASQLLDAPQAGDSFATLPSADQDNPRKPGFSCAIMGAKFVPESD